jgi:hypothetical protein
VSPASASGNDDSRKSPAAPRWGVRSSSIEKFIPQLSRVRAGYFRLARNSALTYREIIEVKFHARLRMRIKINEPLYWFSPTGEEESMINKSDDDLAQYLPDFTAAEIASLRRMHILGVPRIFFAQHPEIQKSDNFKSQIQPLNRKPARYATAAEIYRRRNARHGSGK